MTSSPKNINTKLWKTYLAVLILANQVEAAPPYDIISVENGRFGTYDCTDPSTKYLLADRFPSGSFNLQASPDPRGYKFITNPANGQKVYSMYQVGTNCFMPEFGATSDKNPFFILLIEQEAGGGSKCRVSNIITTARLVPCSGTGLVDIWTAIVFKASSGTPSPEFFDRLTPQFKYFSSIGFSNLKIELKGVDFNSLDEELVEYCLI